MPSRLYVVLTITVLVLVFSVKLVVAKAEQRPLTSEQAQIVDTVSTIFAAALTDDAAKFDSVVAPDFYMYDGGVRFNGNAIIALIKKEHAAGKRFTWNVTEPDVHISGDMAWIAYINKGSVTDASGTLNQNWLESAFLQRQAGTWKIVFMHSTRVSRPIQENHDK